MGPRLGHRLGLGLEPVPRVATCRRPLWPVGLGTVGSAATVGAAAAASTVVGARGSVDVEPDCQRLGFLEQQDLDPRLAACWECWNHRSLISHVSLDKVLASHSGIRHHPRYHFERHHPGRCDTRVADVQLRCLLIQMDDADLTTVDAAQSRLKHYLIRFAVAIDSLLFQ